LSTTPWWAMTFAVYPLMNKQRMPGRRIRMCCMRILPFIFGMTTSVNRISMAPAWFPAIRMASVGVAALSALYPGNVYTRSAVDMECQIGLRGQGP